MVLACDKQSTSRQPTHGSQGARTAPLLDDDDLRTLLKLTDKMPTERAILIHGYRSPSQYSSRLIGDGLGTASHIDFGRLPNATTVHDALRARGIEYIAWPKLNSAAPSTVAANTFFGFVARYVTERKTLDGWLLARVRAKRPALRPQRAVAVLGCLPRYPSGIYTFQDLNSQKKINRRRVIAPDQASRRRELNRVDHIIYRSGCQTEFGPQVLKGFIRIGNHDDHELWLRSPVEKHPVAAPPKKRIPIRTDLVPDTSGHRVGETLCLMFASPQILNLNGQ